MIFVDANVFMYAAGKKHPYKEPSVKFLQRAAAGEIEICIDAQVLQEILHRYRSLQRWEDGKTVFELALKIVPVIHPVDRLVMEQGADLLNRHPSLMARDGLHGGVCLVHGISQLCSFDTDFDVIPGLQRVIPF